MAYAAQLVLAVQRRCGNDSTAPQPSFAAVEPHARPRPSSSGTSSVKLVSCLPCGVQHLYLTAQCWLQLRLPSNTPDAGAVDRARSGSIICHVPACRCLFSSQSAATALRGMCSSFGVHSLSAAKTMQATVRATAGEFSYLIS